MPPDFFNLFVGRDTILGVLTEWTRPRYVPRRLKVITAPPGYGKTWLLHKLAYQLQEEVDLAVILLEAKNLTTEVAIKDQLAKTINNIPNTTPVNTDDPVETILSQLNKDLTSGKRPRCRLIVLVDGLDEPSSEEQRFLQKRLLKPFLGHLETRMIITTRDGFTIKNPTLRRNEDRISLNRFSKNDGQKQLKRRAEMDGIDNEKLSIFNDTFLNLSKFYALSVPGLNTCLYKITSSKMADDIEIVLLTQDILRCIRESIKQTAVDKQLQSKEELEKEMLSLTQYSDGWTIQNFKEDMDCNTQTAIAHIDSLMTLGIVVHNFDQRYKIVDGLRELLLAITEKERNEGGE